jgi:hypothetical protein
MKRVVILTLILVLVLSGAATHLRAQSLWQNVDLDHVLPYPDLTHIQAIAISKSGTIYVGGTSNIDGLTKVYRSTDNGTTWKWLIDTSWKEQVQALTVGPNGNVYVIVGSVLYGSANDGTSWDTLDVSGVSFHTVTVTANGTIVTTPGYGEGIRRSTDGGATWTRMKLPLSEVDVYAISSTEVDTIYAGANGWSTTSLMRSTDNGQTWTEQGGMLHIAVYALAQKAGGYFFVGTWASDSNHSTVYRSNNFGATWKPAGLMKARVTSLATNTRGDLFAGMQSNTGKTAQSGVYRSTDNGETWSAMNAGLRDTNVNAIAVDASGHLIAGTDHGLFRSVASTSSVGNASIEAHEMIVECVPNPYSSNTTIRFTLPVQGHSRLSITNSLGKEVAVPLDRTVEVGSYTVVFDAEQLPAGTYYLRLTAGGSSITRVMVHLR